MNLRASSGSCTVHSWAAQLRRQLATLQLHTRGGCFSKWKQQIPHSISKSASKIPSCDFFLSFFFKSWLQWREKSWEGKKGWACQELAFSKRRERMAGLQQPGSQDLSVPQIISVCPCPLLRGDFTTHTGKAHFI